MGHTAVSTIEVSSVTLNIWQQGAKENYLKFATVNRVVYTKTSIIYMGPNILNIGYKMNLNEYYILAPLFRTGL